MTDFPAASLHGPTITPQSKESIGLQCRASSVSTVWPGNNRAIYVPFTLWSPFPLRRLFWVNGATASGNVDCGVYSEDFTRLVSAGSTAQAGTNVVQSSALGTPNLLLPGRYYMALALSSTVGTIIRGAPGSFSCINGGMAQQTTGAFPLPATATPIQVTSSYVPLFGLTSAGVI